MSVMGVARFERFFRVAADLDVDNGRLVDRMAGANPTALPGWVPTVS